MGSLHGFGLGIVSANAQGEPLDTFYPRPLTEVSGGVAAVLEGVTGRLDTAQLTELASGLNAAGADTLAQLAQQ